MGFVQFIFPVPGKLADLEAMIEEVRAANCPDDSEVAYNFFGGKLTVTPPGGRMPEKGKRQGKQEPKPVPPEEQPKPRHPDSPRYICSCPLEVRDATYARFHKKSSHYQGCPAKAYL